MLSFLTLLLFWCVNITETNGMSKYVFMSDTNEPSNVKFVMCAIECQLTPYI